MSEMMGYPYSINSRSRIIFIEKFTHVPGRTNKHWAKMYILQYRVKKNKWKDVSELWEERAYKEEYPVISDDCYYCKHPQSRKFNSKIIPFGIEDLYKELMEVRIKIINSKRPLWMTKRKHTPLSK